MKNTKHYQNLDGLRGLAALIVVCLHNLTAFAPFLIAGFATQRHSSIDRLVSSSPFDLPIAGNFAVCIFFVLSGFVLSLRFFQTQDSSILIKSAARRYFRLMLPVLGSIMLAYFVIHLGAASTAHSAARLSQSTVWLGSFWNFPAHLGQAIFQGIYGIWLGNIPNTSSYNPILWTMHFELFGSFLIFLSLALLGKQPRRWIFYGIFALIFLKTYYLAFIAGMVISDVFVTQPHIKEVITNKIAWGGLFVGLFLGAWTIDSIYTGIYSHLSLPFFLPYQLELFAHMLGAILVVFAVLKLNVLAKLFERKTFQRLGRVSFSLYLTHFIILSTLSSYVFYHLSEAYGYKISVLATGLIGLSASLIVATLYTKWVDAPSIKLSRFIGNLIMGEATLQVSLPKLFRLPLVARLIKRAPIKEATPELQTFPTE